MKITIAELRKDELPQTEWHSFRTKICYMSLWRCIALICTLFVILTIALIFKTYLRAILIWLQYQNSTVISVTILILFILVSLPVIIGYIVLVVSTGYFFGFINGLCLTVIGANFGLLVAHNLLKLVGHHHSIYRFTQSQTAQAIMRVILGPLCFKIVMFSRLTPIPFGLQNTIFALSNINTKVYHLASFIGLLPAQVIGAYVGSTLRSMQDVLENKNISSITYIFITLQLLVGASTIIWLGSKARKELVKALTEAENSGPNNAFMMV